MTAYPLTQPITSLSPARRVYVERKGLAFLYPAAVVWPPLNEIVYTMDDDRPWNPTPADWDAGRLLASRVDLDQVDHVALRAYALVLWRGEGASEGHFYRWWSNVNPDAHPEWIGAAARVAARELMTWPLFVHRHMVDASQAFA